MTLTRSILAILGVIALLSGASIWAALRLGARHDEQMENNHFNG